jgi:hypothetical protein
MLPDPLVALGTHGEPSRNLYPPARKGKKRVSRLKGKERKKKNRKERR